MNKVFNITLRTIMEGQSIVNVDEIHRAARFFLSGQTAGFVVPEDQMQSVLMYSKFCALAYAAAYPDAHIMMMSASLLQEGDVVLVVTHSGRTSDVKAAVELAKKNGQDYLYNA